MATTEENHDLTIIVKVTRYGREADNLDFIRKVENELIMRFGVDVIRSVALEGQ